MQSSAAEIASADVVVAGAGAAGLMAAIAAGEGGAGVVLCEQLDRPGVKLLATGGGRCNLTNTVPAKEFMARFGRFGRFMQPALAAMGSQGLRRFFLRLGVPTYCPDGLHVFPSSNSAGTVQRALLRRCQQLGVKVLLKRPVAALRIEDGHLRGVMTGGGTISARRVVLTTGGKSYPELGATGTGYDLTRQAGHRIVPPTPALVPLVTKETVFRRCAGVSVPGRIWIDLPGQVKAGQTGEILFTHRGLSGPAVLDLSGDVAGLLGRWGEVPIRLDLTSPWRGSGAGASQLPGIERIDQLRRDHPRRQIATLLAGRVPKSLAQAICLLAGIDPKTPAEGISAAAGEKLQTLLRALPLTVIDTEGFARAMVTRGGVDLREVDPQTLASKVLAGLFLAGELLDLDGPCGGYNLQWAFSSGHLGGRSAAGK